MSSPIVPEVLWAQRSSSVELAKNLIYLTINVSDISTQSLKLDITPTKVTFSGSSKNKDYALELELHEEIDPAESKYHHTPRDIEMVLRKKKAKDEYWPKLLKDSKKMHFLKTDFDKWVDQEEQEEQSDDPMAGQFGEDGGLGNLDFSKLGAGGLGGLTAGGASGGSDDEDDEEMPGLEPAEQPAETETAKSGIEEVPDKQ